MSLEKTQAMLLFLFGMTALIAGLFLWIFDVGPQRTIGFALYILGAVAATIGLLSMRTRSRASSTTKGRAGRALTIFALGMGFFLIGMCTFAAFAKVDLEQIPLAAAAGIFLIYMGIKNHKRGS